jgi:zeaxanthin glucosyltransferase
MRQATKKIAIFSQPTTKSHTNTVIPVARRLIELGHEVCWFSTGREQAAAIEAAGIPLRRTRGQHHLPGSTEEKESWLDPKAMAQGLRALLLDSTRELLPEVRELLAEFGPDAAAVDCATWVGLLACHAEGVPWIGLSMSLKSLRVLGLTATSVHGVLADIAPERDALFQQFGLTPNFRQVEYQSPYGTAVFTTERFVGPEVREPGLHFVGPSMSTGARGDEPADFPFERLTPERPLVYVAFGSFWDGLCEPLFPPIIEAARSLGAQVVFAAKPKQALALPDDDSFIVVPYAPQLQILKRASAFVTHGGGGSFMEALYHGVPMAVVPIGGDQPVQAYFAEKAGVGLRLALDTRSVPVWRDTLERLIDPQGPVRARMREVSTDFHAHDGALGAAQLVLGLERRA